ncbi:MAG: LptF/LptG family permease [Armatimonadetes bacterium]|nr:LptF/LptG family permease [Armatimonadota bacterium]
MKKLDRLIFVEIVGPWVFGVAMFTLLIMAGQYLFALTDYLVQGIPPATVLELTGLYMPGIIAKTFPMAVLLATLLGFGRLSGDSEIVAIRAGGISLFRIMQPVAIFALGIAILSFAVDELLVPAAARESEAIKASIAKTLDVKSVNPISQPIMRDGSLVGQIVAQDFVPGSMTMRGVTVVSYDKDRKPLFYMHADELVFDPTEIKSGQGWRIRGKAQLLSADGQNRLEISNGAWPENVAGPTQTPTDLLASKTNSMDNFSLTQLGEKIQTLKAQKDVEPTRIRNLQFFYWNKIALPLSALVYGLLGAPLGIRGHRASTASGFALSIGIIFGYITLANLLNVYSMGGLLPAFVASLAPVGIGLIASGVIIWRRNA